MKTNFLVFALLFLLTAGLCFAQDASSNAPQAPASADAQQPAAAPDSQQAQANVGQANDANEQSFKGCVSGQKDNYILTDENGTKFRLHSDKDINEHVGQSVEVRGTVNKEGADRASTSTESLQEIDVANIKTVGGSCSAGMTK